MNGESKSPVRNEKWLVLFIITPKKTIEYVQAKVRIKLTDFYLHIIWFLQKKKNITL